MSTQAVVKTAEGTPQQIAYRLFHDVARAEGKLDPTGNLIKAPDRKWILDTYAECLRATTGRRGDGGTSTGTYTIA